MGQTVHQPVLLNEVIDLVRVRDKGIYIDATLGGGGYSEALLRAGAGLVIGLDWDHEALARTGIRLERYGEKVRLIRAGFQELESVVAHQDISQVDGVVADLGLSSDQLAGGQRGFSFLKDGPLDMRQDQRSPTAAAEIVNRADESELKRIFGRYGEEPKGGRIARAIIAARSEKPIKTTRELAELIESVVGRGKPGTHPATKAFQALRIAVNNELENLDRLLAGIEKVLSPGGRAVVVAYHSLEDRKVKQAFRRLAQSCTCPPGRPCICGGQASFRLLTRKPVVPGQAEIEANPRARSAKLRAMEKI